MRQGIFAVLRMVAQYTRINNGSPHHERLQPPLRSPSMNSNLSCDGTFLSPPLITSNPLKGI